MEYRVRITELDDGGYEAVCLDLPGCLVRARTLDRIKERIEDEVEGYLASLDTPMPATRLRRTTTHQEIRRLQGDKRLPANHNAQQADG